nr:PD-(D/E)XK nuclease family protein [Salinirubrum litoreum]
MGTQEKAEVYATRLLRYFLDPSESHGLDDILLRQFIELFPEESAFQEDRTDLSDVTVETEVKVNGAAKLGGTRESDRTGYVDLVVSLPAEWFLMVEVKFYAGENNLTGDRRPQTEFYQAATHVDGVDKDNYESGEYYLYLHPNDTAQATADGFESMAWSTVTSEIIAPVLADHSPRLPQRTVNQLHEFTDDIEDLTGMSEESANRQEKIELYIDHYDAISDVQSTFEGRWEEFTNEWGDLLAETCSDSIRNEWIFRDGTDDWAFLFKHDWWRDAETLEPLGRTETNNNTLRVGFLHRLEHNRDLAVGDRELKFYFRNTPPNRHTTSGDTNFRDEFVANFEARTDSIGDELPEAAYLTGNMHNVIEATYDIPVAEYDDYFEAYLSALNTAFNEHVIENPQLVAELEDAYSETLENFR